MSESFPFKSRRLELGSGKRPTEGFISNDINDFDGIDIVGNPWEIDLPDESLEEVLALGVIEHITFEQVNQCFANVFRMLKPGGQFYFDVPDLVAWCRYAVDHAEGREVPFDRNHVLSTLYGWQRWPGDEHKSGWYHDHLEETLAKAGFTKREYDVNLFLNRGIERRRMLRPADAHFFCVATKV